MIQTDIPCRRCDQPMIEISVGRHYVLQCNNSGCPKYKERQGCREKNIGLGPITEFIPVPLPNNPLPSKKKRKGKKGRVK